MFVLEVHDEDFQGWMDAVEVRIRTMMQTLLDIAQIVEMNTQKLVPYDYNKPWGEQHLETSFKAVPTGYAREGWIEVEIGYSSLDPRDNYDYAEYIHDSVDYRTGKPLHFQKQTAEDHYLFKGIELSRKEGFQEIATDYLSLFRRR